MNKLEHAYFEGFVKAAGEFGAMPDELINKLNEVLKGTKPEVPAGISGAAPKALEGSPIPNVPPANFELDPTKLPNLKPLTWANPLPSSLTDEGLTTGTPQLDDAANTTTPVDTLLAKGPQSNPRAILNKLLGNKYLEGKLGRPGSQSASQGMATAGLGIGAAGGAGYLANQMKPGYQPVELAPNAAYRKAIEDAINSPANNPFKSFLNSAEQSVKDHPYMYGGAAVGGAGLAALTHYLHNRKPAHPGLSDEPGIDDSEIQ
jgi:hypothetical protein